LCGFLGLRPSEVNALDWSDVDFEHGMLHLRRAWVAGEISGMKTASSVASIPFIQPVLGLLKVQHVACGSPSTGWVFPSRNGKAPLSIKVFVKKQIIPVLPATSHASTSVHYSFESCYPFSRSISLAVFDCTLVRVR
jgi:integrase